MEIDSIKNILDRVNQIGDVLVTALKLVPCGAVVLRAEGLLRKYFTSEIKVNVNGSVMMGKNYDETNELLVY